MWRYYSKGNGGYGLKCWNLIFDQYRENSFFKIQDNDLFSLFRSFMVLYNRQEKENRLEKIILDTFSAFNNSDDSEKEKNALGFLRSQLKDLEFRFKNECYASEQEYRFVYYRPRKKPESMPFRLPEVLYRVQRGVIVPYIDIVVDRGASHLHEVMISPLVKEKNADKMTKDYLTQCGFDCPVRKSELPVRY